MELRVQNSFLKIHWVIERGRDTRKAWLACLRVVNFTYIKIVLIRLDTFILKGLWAQLESPQNICSFPISIEFERFGRPSWGSRARARCCLAHRPLTLVLFLHADIPCIEHRAWNARYTFLIEFFPSSGNNMARIKQQIATTEVTIQKHLNALNKLNTPMSEFSISVSDMRRLCYLFIHLSLRYFGNVCQIFAYHKSLIVVENMSAWRGGATMVSPEFTQASEAGVVASPFWVSSAAAEEE